MNTTENIQQAQEQVADLQSRLDQVQQVLDKAERIAAGGQVAKTRAEQLLVVSITLVVIGVVFLALGGLRRQKS